MPGPRERLKTKDRVKKALRAFSSRKMRVNKLALRDEACVGMRLAAIPPVPDAWRRRRVTTE